MNMTSPTGDAVMLATAITSFCSLTVKCRFHSFVGPRPIRSSSRLGMTSEGPFQDYYLLVVSTQKSRTRRSEETTGLNSTRVGRMLVLRDQEKMQMRKQSQRTTWGTGMNPTGRYVHMFEEEEKEIWKSGFDIHNVFRAHRVRV